MNNQNISLLPHKLLQYGSLSLLFFLAACTSGFDDVNTDRHRLTDDDLERDYQNVGAFFTQMESRVVLFDDGSGNCLSSDYQVAQGLSADPFSGYVGLTGTWRNGIHNGSYSFVSGWYDQMFRRAFSEVMPAWQKMRQKAEEQQMPQVAALADIVKVEALHRVTDMYGPIPYIHFGSGTLGTAYDSQQAVYRHFFTELDNAIDVLTPYAEADEQMLADYDIVYGGQVRLWVKFANTLRLRLAMRVSYADEALARQEAQKSEACPIGYIETTDQRAELQHNRVTYYHPNYDMAYTFNAGEIRMSASMDSYMNGYNDPRRAAYFVEAANGGYHGVRLGVHNMNPTRYAGNGVSNLNIDRTTTPIVWMTAAESFFLRAEAVVRGFIQGDAKTLYENGIRASFSENNVQGADSFIADSESVPAKYEDPTGGSNSHEAMSAITIAWDDDASAEQKLERIITQKWIALYPDGCEGWAEYRRTGYPRLFPVVNNDSGGTIDTDLQVRRCPFPVEEYNTNATVVEAAVQALSEEALGGGADNGGTRLWWDRKNLNIEH